LFSLLPTLIFLSVGRGVSLADGSGNVSASRPVIKKDESGSD
jgi:hypothetical protein